MHFKHIYYIKRMSEENEENFLHKYYLDKINNLKKTKFNILICLIK